MVLPEMTVAPPEGRTVPANAIPEGDKVNVWPAAVKVTALGSSAELDSWVRAVGRAMVELLSMTSPEEPT